MGLHAFTGLKTVHNSDLLNVT